MAYFVFYFGYEPPALRRANDAFGSDMEDSVELILEARDERHASERGGDLAEAFVRWVFTEAAWIGAIPSWSADRYASWVEAEGVEAAQARGAPLVRLADHPDFSAWLSENS